MWKTEYKDTSTNTSGKKRTEKELPKSRLFAIAAKIPTETGFSARMKNSRNQSSGNECASRFGFCMVLVTGKPEGNRSRFTSRVVRRNDRNAYVSKHEYKGYELRRVQKKEEFQCEGKHEHDVGGEEVMKEENEWKGEGGREEMDGGKQVVAATEERGEEEDEGDEQKEEREKGRGWVGLLVVGEQEEECKTAQVEKGGEEEQEWIVRGADLVAHGEGNPSYD